MEGKWPSLSSLDRRICSLFFYWSTWNVFLGAMLGGSAFSQLGIIVNNPGSIPRIIGTALPASSNFFINYVIIQVSLPLPHNLQLSSQHATLMIRRRGRSMRWNDTCHSPLHIAHSQCCQLVHVAGMQ